MIVNTPYPMTIAQLSAWAKEQRTVAECARALHDLDERRITIRKVG